MQKEIGLDKKPIPDATELSRYILAQDVPFAGVYPASYGAQDKPFDPAQDVLQCS
ncbi:MAG: hypothetical protein V3U73_08080 [bacterium]